MGLSTCIEDAKLLLSLSPKERKAVLKVLDIKRIRSICECAHNLLCGNVRPSDRSKLGRLRKHRATLRRLAKRGESWAKKRSYLVQKGRGVGFILPLLLSTVLQAALNHVTK